MGLHVTDGLRDDPLVIGPHPGRLPHQCFTHHHALRSGVEDSTDLNAKGMRM